MDYDIEVRMIADLRKRIIVLDEKLKIYQDKFKEMGEYLSQELHIKISKELEEMRKYLDKVRENIESPTLNLTNVVKKLDSFNITSVSEIKRGLQVIKTFLIFLLILLGIIIGLTLIIHF